LREKNCVEVAEVLKHCHKETNSIFGGFQTFSQRKHPSIVERQQRAWGKWIIGISQPSIQSRVTLRHVSHTQPSIQSRVTLRHVSLNTHIAAHTINFHSLLFIFIRVNSQHTCACQPYVTTTLRQRSLFYH
jgi:hypothetical protein